MGKILCPSCRRAFLDNSCPACGKALNQNFQIQRKEQKMKCKIMIENVPATKAIGDFMKNHDCNFAFSYGAIFLISIASCDGTKLVFSPAAISTLSESELTDQIDTLILGLLDSRRQVSSLKIAQSMANDTNKN